MRTRLGLAILLLCTSSYAQQPPAPAPAPAPAPTSADDKARARALFDQGRALGHEGKWSEACPKLEAAERLDHGIGTLFNLADCYEHVFKIALAWTIFVDVADASKHANQPDREAIARGRAAALAPRIAKIKLRVATPIPPGLEVKIDDHPVFGVVIDKEVGVDSGKHRIVASAPGKMSAAREIETPQNAIGSADVTIVDVPVLADIPSQAKITPPPSTTSPPTHEQPPPTASTSSSSWQKPVALGAGAVGVVALSVGTFFGLRASSKWSDAEESCPNNRCNSAGASGWESAKDNALIANVAIGVGLVLIGAAVVLWITAPPSSSLVGAR